MLAREVCSLTPGCDTSTARWKSLPNKSILFKGERHWSRVQVLDWRLKTLLTLWRGNMTTTEGNRIYTGGQVGCLFPVCIHVGLSLTLAVDLDWIRAHLTVSRLRLNQKPQSWQEPAVYGRKSGDVISQPTMRAWFTLHSYKKGLITPAQRRLWDWLSQGMAGKKQLLKQLDTAIKLCSFTSRRLCLCYFSMLCQRCLRLWVRLGKLCFRKRGIDLLQHTTHWIHE